MEDREHGIPYLDLCFDIPCIAMDKGVLKAFTTPLSANALNLTSQDQGEQYLVACEQRANDDATGRLDEFLRQVRIVLGPSPESCQAGGCA